jgi:DTW domain-containing protein YfiP
MHSKEFRKTKNGTGIFSHLSLPNSELFVGIDFSDNKQIDAIVEDQNNNCFILYPSKNSLILNDTQVVQSGKTTVIFLIDSTWACAKKIMRVSQNIKDLPRLSFYHDRVSAFHIKEQPNEICLSTIESIQTVLGLLETHITQESLETFLTPFHEMVKYQMTFTKEIHG